MSCVDILPMCIVFVHISYNANGQHEAVKHSVMFARKQFCDDQRPVWPHSNQRDMAIRCFVATLAGFFVVTSADEPEFRSKSVDVKWCEYVYKICV